MYLYKLTCPRCTSVKKYKTSIAPEHLNVDACICGGKMNVILLTDNADNEVEDLLSYESELGFALP